MERWTCIGGGSGPPRRDPVSGGVAAPGGGTAPRDHPYVPHEDRPPVVPPVPDVDEQRRNEPPEGG